MADLLVKKLLSYHSWSSRKMSHKKSLFLAYFQPIFRKTSFLGRWRYWWKMKLTYRESLCSKLSISKIKFCVSVISVVNFRGSTFITWFHRRYVQYSAVPIFSGAPILMKISGITLLYTTRPQNYPKIAQTSESGVIRISNP